MNHVILLSSCEFYTVNILGHKGGRMQHFSGLLEQLRQATLQIKELKAFYERLKHLFLNKTFHVTVLSIFFLVLSKKNAFFYFVIILGYEHHVAAILISLATRHNMNDSYQV